MTPPDRTVAIFLGALLGGAARYALSVALPGERGFDPALALLAVNLSGSLLAGFARASFERTARAGAPRHAELVEAFTVVGFAGGFTSYSAFAVAPGGAVPILATLVGCPVAALAGLLLGRGYPARPTEDPR
jgi:fluoride ion exporter CrcB/FEX